VYVRGVRLAFGRFRGTESPRVRAFCAAFAAVYCAMLVYGMADATLIAKRVILWHGAFLGLLGAVDAEAERGEEP